MIEKVTVLGAGAWGTAWASLLANNGIPVSLWCHEAEVVAAIAATGVNSRYLPNIKLPTGITPTHDIAAALARSEIVFEAVPVAFLRPVLTEIKSFVNPGTPWVILSKGIEQHSLMLPSQVVSDVLGTSVPTAVISGPTFATELAHKAFSAATLACTDASLAKHLMHTLARDYFKFHLSDDLIGVQVGGAIKNVIALAVGIARGAGYGENTIAFLITKGLAEVVSIASVLGGKAETLYGLAGLGDLILTCTGTHSKNLRVGTMIGKGMPIAQVKQEIPVLPEGVNTVQSVRELAHKHQLPLALCLGIYACMFQQRPFAEVLAQL